MSSTAESRSPQPQEPQDGPITSSSEPVVAGTVFEGMTRSQALNLYTSHFLSTWNMRAYEFAAIIFTAAAYPETLIAASIRGIVRTVASICFSSLVGRWVDRNPNRLMTLSSTLSVNRIAVICASTLWFFIVKPGNSASLAGTFAQSELFGISTGAIVKGFMFALILLLEIFESLSASGNMISMERDWVVAAAAPDGMPYDLTHLNSSMRRLDLICKLIAPILISVVVSATNVKYGVIVVGSASSLSWAVELWCARRVWDLNPRLRAPKIEDDEQGAPLPPFVDSPTSIWGKITESGRRYVQDFRNYFSTNVWIPSLSLAFLHLSALSYSATFITYLLAVGFSLDIITIARAAGSIVEISSTVVTPIGVKYLGEAVNHGRYHGEEVSSEESIAALLESAPEQEARTETGLERLGLWGISWQLINLLPVVYALWLLSPNYESSPPSLVYRLFNPLPSRPLLAFIIFFFLSISRLGLWIYDITTQQLTQTMTLPSQRSSFTGVEYSFVSIFELGHHIMTLALHRPAQFKWTALISLSAVAVSTVSYAGWVWKMRGHLMHWDRIKGCDCAKAR